MDGRTEREIGGFTFYIKEFPAFEALKLAGDLQKKFVGPAAGLIATHRNEAASNDDFAEGLRKFSAGLDGTQLVEAFKMLVKPQYVSVVNPNGGDISLMDEGTVGILKIKLPVLVALAIEVAKINFADFIVSVRSLFSQAGQSATE